MLLGKHQHQDRKSSGLILDRGWRYDLEVWFFDTFLVRGQVTRLRGRVLDLAGVSGDHPLLDVGCGTGTLAIEAARRLGSAGRVSGVDPGPRQIERARSKARRAGVEIDVRPGVIESLPYPDESFDAVTSTLMMHHLPGDVRERGLAEIRRVLKPQGRVIVADVDDSDGHGSPINALRNGFETGSLADQLQNRGFRLLSTERVMFDRPHHGWSGATLTSAEKA